MIRHERFAAFILTHGRPDNVLTFETLRRAGYTGRVVLVVDDEDPTGDEYRERFGPENVVQFSKAAVAGQFDEMDTGRDRRVIVYARNACFGIAEGLGLDYFLELDDDYTDFLHRYVEGPRLRSAHVHDFDRVVDLMLDLLDDTGAATVALAQGGDYMGGIESGTLALGGVKRKAMNSFFLRTDRPVRFLGRINEDVNTYVLEGSRGALFLTMTALQLNQVQTQKASGGMTEAYLAAGTYVKSFYTVMAHPSSVQIATMGRVDRRFHHLVRWDRTVPCIVPERFRKE